MTCLLIRCVVVHRPGRASESISGTSLKTSAPHRKHPIPTTTPPASGAPCIANLCNLWLKLPRLEDQLDFMRRHDLQLLIRAIRRLLITPPPPKLRCMPKPIALHVLVRD